MNAARGRRGYGNVVGCGCLSVVCLLGFVFVIAIINHEQPELAPVPAPKPRPKVVERAYLDGGPYYGDIDVGRSADILAEYQRDSRHWNKNAMWKMRRDGRVFLIESCIGPPVEVEVWDGTSAATEVHILNGYHAGETGFVDSKDVTHEKPKSR